MGWSWNPIEDIKHVGENVASAADRLTDEAFAIGKELVKYGPGSKVIGEYVRTSEKVWDDLSTGDLWGAFTDNVKGNAEIVHDVVNAVRMPTCAWDQGAKLEALLANGQGNSKEFAQAVDSLNTLWDESGNPPGYGGTTRGDHKYYDDNAWIGIAFMDAYKQNPDNPAYLQRAEQIFDLEVYGTRGTESLPHPGGVFWTQAPGNDYRATVSTAGAAQLALLLYGETKDQKYLDFAEKQFNWVNDTLKGDNGLYFDGIGRDSEPDKIDPAQWSYNQGLMLGNATLLYQATGDRHYLDQAQEIAKNSLAAFGPGGNPGWTFSDQPLFFNAVFFKNLMLLDSVEPNKLYRQELSRYANEVTQGVATGDVLFEKQPGYSNAVASAEQILALAAKNPPLP